MQILPIKELRDANKISDLCNETNEPIFINKNGYGCYEHLNLWRKIRKNWDVWKYTWRFNKCKGKKVVDGISALNGLKSKYGL